MKSKWQGALSFTLVIVAILMWFLFIKQASYIVFDMPQACSYNDGETISSFEILRKDKKTYVKVFPGSKAYKAILEKGEYKLVHIAPPWMIK